jgi:hypothetical protein
MENQIKLPDNLEVDKVENGVIYLKEKKQDYPKTFQEALDVLGLDREQVDPDRDDRSYGKIWIKYRYTFSVLYDLLILRDAWWKIDNDWDVNKESSGSCYKIVTTGNYLNRKLLVGRSLNGGILAFRTKELAERFLEEFRTLIEDVKNFI